MTADTQEPERAAYTTTQQQCGPEDCFSTAWEQEILQRYAADRRSISQQPKTQKHHV